MHPGTSLSTCPQEPAYPPVSREPACLHASRINLPVCVQGPSYPYVSGEPPACLHASRDKPARLFAGNKPALLYPGNKPVSREQPARLYPGSSLPACFQGTRLPGCIRGTSLPTCIQGSVALQRPALQNLHSFLGPSRLPVLREQHASLYSGPIWLFCLDD